MNKQNFEKRLEQEWKHISRFPTMFTSKEQYFYKRNFDRACRNLKNKVRKHLSRITNEEMDLLLENVISSNIHVEAKLIIKSEITDEKLRRLFLINKFKKERADKR